MSPTTPNLFSAPNSGSLLLPQLQDKGCPQSSPNPSDGGVSTALQHLRMLGCPGCAEHGPTLHNLPLCPRPRECMPTCSSAMLILW